MSWITKVIAAVKTATCPDNVDVPANYAGIVHTDSVTKATWVAGPGTYRCRLNRAASQALGASGSTTAVVWDTEQFDDGGFVVVPASLVTIPAGMSGQYLVTFTVQFAGPLSSTAGERAVLWARNSLTTVVGQVGAHRISFPGEDIATLTFTQPMNAGDQFDFTVFHTDASSPPAIAFASVDIVWQGPNQ